MENKDIEVSENTPHDKKFFTTRFGRFLDSISYFRLTIITAGLWLFSTLYFWWATIHYPKHGLNINVLDCNIVCENINLDILLSSLYFSGVTITTLGYGDVLPLGWGKLFAVLLAVGGLTLIAILISKVSSERQFSMLLLLHTSDVEKRLSGFTNDTSKYIDKLQLFSYEKKIKEYELLLKESKTKGTRVRLKNNNLTKTLKNFRALLQISSRYMVFHINQSLSFEVGTSAAVAQFLNKLSDAQKIILSLKDFARQHESIENSCITISKNICYIERVLLENTKKKGLDESSFKNFNFSDMHEAFEKWQSSTYTESWVNKVKQELPSGPRSNWPHHPHKKIAKKLGISNTIVSQCINELKRRGEC